MSHQGENIVQNTATDNEEQASMATQPPPPDSVLEDRDGFTKFLHQDNHGRKLGVVDTVENMLRGSLIEARERVEPLSQARFRYLQWKDPERFGTFQNEDVKYLMREITPEQWKVVTERQAWNKYCEYAFRGSDQRMVFRSIIGPFMTDDQISGPSGVGRPGMPTVTGGPRYSNPAISSTAPRTVRPGTTALSSFESATASSSVGNGKAPVRHMLLLATGEAFASGGASGSDGGSAAANDGGAYASSSTTPRTVRPGTTALSSVGKGKAPLRHLRSRGAYASLDSSGSGTGRAASSDGGVYASLGAIRSDGGRASSSSEASASHPSSSAGGDASRAGASASHPSSIAGAASGSGSGSASASRDNRRRKVAGGGSTTQSSNRRRSTEDATNRDAVPSQLPSYPQVKTEGDDEVQVVESPWLEPLKEEFKRHLQDKRMPEDLIKVTVNAVERVLRAMVSGLGVPLFPRDADQIKGLWEHLQTRHHNREAIKGQMFQCPWRTADWNKFVEFLHPELTARASVPPTRMATETGSAAASAFCPSVPLLTQQLQVTTGMGTTEAASGPISTPSIGASATGTGALPISTPFINGSATGTRALPYATPSFNGSAGAGPAEAPFWPGGTAAAHPCLPHTGGLQWTGMGPQASISGSNPASATGFPWIVPPQVAYMMMSLAGMNHGHGQIPGAMPYAHGQPPAYPYPMVHPPHANVQPPAHQGAPAGDGST